MKTPPLPMKHTASATLAVLALWAAALPAAALDLSWSGFATLGYARSGDAPGRYLRWIDADGTFNTESVLAGQLDARLSPQWSATVQLKAAPSEESDSRWALRPAWAFVAWRPNDEWLLRAGRMRVPLYLNSESLDIGVAHDMARLPVEMYSIVPSNDFNGLAGAYSRPTAWLADGELAVEAYAGRIGSTVRFWHRDGLPPQVPAGADFRKVDVQVFGLVATLRSPRTTLRLGLHDARTEQADGKGTPVAYPFVPIAPGLGYYRVDEALPGPPIATVGRIRNIVTTLGAEHRFGEGWRMSAELARGKQQRTELGSDTLGGYVAVFKEIDRFTPYASYGRLKTGATHMDSYRRLSSSQLPPFVPGAAQINAAQRLAAESIYVANQDTWALGTAWRTPLGGTLKLEHARTRIGEVTRLVDTPAGQPTPQHQSFGTWTVNYSLAF